MLTGNQKNNIEQRFFSSLKSKHVYGPGIDESICMITISGETETMYCYHFDGLGLVVALSDSNTNIVETYSYAYLQKVKSEE